MEFRFTQEEEDFRQEVRQFIREELPSTWQGYWEVPSDEQWDFYKSFVRKVAARGWRTMDWPTEYGGQSTSPWRKVVLTEEMAYHRAPMQDNMALYVGRILMQFGTEEQKQKYLPPITSGEVEFCFGMTEPESGSDVASLKTLAIEDGDHYILRGQKVFTTRAHRANYCWLAARTDQNVPKHRGISMFIVDMNAPGITVKPLINMAGTHAFNEVFFDDVSVSKNCLLGEKNHGWMILTAGLGLERTGSGGGPGDAARAKRCLDELVKYVKETIVDGKPLSKDPIVRRKLSRMAVEIEVGRLLSYRPTWFAANGIEAKFEASISKLFGSEMSQRVAQIETEITGLKGLLRPESPGAVIGGRSCFDYMFTWVRIFGGGTTDIQRNIIALRHLGLPKG